VSLQVILFVLQTSSASSPSVEGKHFTISVIITSCFAVHIFSSFNHVYRFLLCTFHFECNVILNFVVM